MAIHIVIGFPDPGAHSAVEAVYVGRDNDAARAARDAYPGVSTQWYRNPADGLRKENMGRSLARDAAARADEQQRLASADLPAPPTAEMQLSAAEREIADLKEQLAAAELALETTAESLALANLELGELSLIADPDPALDPAQPSSPPSPSGGGDVSESVEDKAEPHDDPTAVVGDPAAEERRDAALAMSAAAQSRVEAPAKGKDAKPATKHHD